MSLGTRAPAVSIVVGLLAAAAALVALPAPAVFAAVFLSAAFLHGAIAWRRPVVRLALLNCSLLLMVFTVAEAAALWRAAPPLRDETTDADGRDIRFRAHDVLGYGPPASASVRWRRFSGADLLFDVTYHTDAHARRITPQVDGPHDCVLFLGDSFTFGAGVRDEQTLPHLVGTALAPRYAAVNFGFSGYGPHQALAAMEHGLIDAVGCRPRHAIYFAIPDHAMRAARQQPWDLHGPRYERAADGSAVARGHFDDPDAPRDGALSRLAMRALSKSRLLDWLVVRPLTTVASDADIALMVAVTQGQARWLQAHAPGCDFSVLFWDEPGSAVGERILDALARTPLRVDRVSAMLDGFASDPSQYELHPRDRHPNPRAYALLADALVRRITSAPPGTR